MSIRNIGKRIGRCGAVWALVLAGVWLSGCGTSDHFAALPPGLAASSGAGTAHAPDPAAPAPTSVAASAVRPAAGGVMTNSSAPQAEVFRAGDSLTIVYADLPQPTPAFQGKIKEDGTITLLLNQKFMAAGKTAGQLEDEIRETYVPKIFKYLTVTVTPDVNTRWFYVDGEVGSHGSRQIYTSRTTVLQAIASAGGFTDFAKKTKVKLTRVDGRVYIINCTKARDNPALDLEIYPGDKVYVPRKLW